MYAIAGVTGHTGSVVAETLLSQGEPVRVVVRDAAKGDRWRARGAEVAVADLSDTEALTAALRGVDGAYLLIPPRVDLPDPLEHNRGVIGSIAGAVRAAKVPHVVLLSSAGAQHAAGTGPIVSLHLAEEELAKTGAALTAVRAAYFVENWGAVLGALAQGVLPTFLPADVAVPMVATADIGRVAARALVEGGTGRRVIELAGPRDYAPADLARSLGVVAQEAPLDAVVPTFTSLGFSRGVAELFRELFAAIASGHVAFTAQPTRGTVEAEAVLRELSQR